MSRTRAITKAPTKQLPSRAEFDTHVGGARLAIGRAEALTHALHSYFDERHVTTTDDAVAERRVSHLIDMAAAATVEAFEELDRAGDSLRGGDGVPDADWGDA
jgi:hypothetical protein